MTTQAYVAQDDSELNVIFIHSKLDDIGLTANQFRIFAHLSRRAHSAGKAWPGIDSMSKICKMHKETVIEVIRQLESFCMIFADRRAGKSTIYRLAAPSKWVVGNGERSEMGNAAVGNGERDLSEMGNERKSKEGNPKKEIQPSIKSKVSNEQVEVIYRAYPRKVGKAAAFKKIAKALATVPFDQLLAAVNLYAAAREGQPSKFTPHPATWFEQGRYDDDPNEWQRKPGRKAEDAPSSAF